MKEYEISIWDDINGEQKIAVIGSNTMRDSNVLIRVVEPKFVTNVNGTHQLTFKMYTSYLDPISGNKIINPYLPYLVVERKIKVKWENEWYDLLIKDISENSKDKSITYICEDLYITELGRNGYNLEFDTDLQNNIGTAPELVKAVLHNSGWEYDEENSDKIIQEIEEPVFEVELEHSFIGIRQNPGKAESDTTLNFTDNNVINKKLLIFYSQIAAIKDEDCVPEGQDPTNTKYRTIPIQFWYDPESDYICEQENSMVVSNGYCWKANFAVVKNENKDENNNNNILSLSYTFYRADEDFTVNFSSGPSTKYRAKRLVESHEMEYDELLGQYVYKYLKNESTWSSWVGMTTTEYERPQNIVNYLVNTSNFTNTSGWENATKNSILWELYPEFNANIEVNDYHPKSYLFLKASKYFYNNGLQANNRYFSPTEAESKKVEVGGIQNKEKYILRLKAKASIDSNTYLKETDANSLPYIVLKEMNNKHEPLDGAAVLKTYDSAKNYFTNGSWENSDNDYIYIILTCNHSCSALELKNGLIGFFLYTSTDIYIEDIQFFKYMLNSNNNLILPGDKTPDPKIVTRYKYYQIFRDSKNKARLSKNISPWASNTDYSVDNLVARNGIYYKCKTANQDSTWNSSNWTNITSEVILKSAEDITFSYNDTVDSNEYTPCISRYEKVTGISVNHSNRFNLLQEIAEKFNCWIRFNIEHEDDGRIKLQNNYPIKKVILKREIGNDLGWSFEYGIDLDSITRKTISKEITTKTIVGDSNNEFATNKFCAIQDSIYNFSKENFILDFSYYLRQNLINKEQLFIDLYSTNGLKYYTQLRTWYTEYDKKAAEVQEMENSLIHYQAELSAKSKERDADQEQLITLLYTLKYLTGKDTLSGWKEDEQNLSKENKARIANYIIIDDRITELNTQITKLTNDIKTLNNNILTRKARLKQLIYAIQNKHLAFFRKYYRYIQEGVWQDDSYTSPDKYYLDAISVAYQSALPKISYDIKVISLNALPEFKNKTFEVGDICYVQDKEFFGYNQDNITPLKMRITITEITNNFDSPEKDIIKVKTYSSHFDDLFQRITAATQQLQYYEGSYKRSMNAVNPNSSISYNSLNSTMKEFGSVWQ